MAGVVVVVILRSAYDQIEINCVPLISVQADSNSTADRMLDMRFLQRAVTLYGNLPQVFIPWHTIDLLCCRHSDLLDFSPILHTSNADQKIVQSSSSIIAQPHDVFEHQKLPCEHGPVQLSVDGRNPWQTIYNRDTESSKYSTNDGESQT